MPKSFSSKHMLTLIGLLACLLAACTITPQISPSESEPAPNMNTPPSTLDDCALPAPLSYLESGQIWQLDIDAHSLQQITQESAPIDAFDLSAGGMLIYVSNNSLILSDVHGQNRQVLREGQPLNTISDELDRLNNSGYITTAIRTPLWSPNGQKIAFIQNGLQIVDVETQQAEMVWPQATTSSDPILFESVLGWSPDGQYLLVSQYPYPIESHSQRWISVLQLDGPLYPKVSGRLGETFAWSTDSKYLFLANAFVGSDRSLMRCDPETMQCRLIAEFEPARWYYYYAHPFVTADERLLVFMGASEDPDQPPEAFDLISVRLDGYDRRNLRSDGYVIDSALWSPDGEGVLITLAQAAGEKSSIGSILWLSITGESAIPLPLRDATNLLWGLAHN